MAQFARPDADQAAGSWTTTPLWSKVDEGSDGGDTISSDAVGSGSATTNADLRLSDVTDPVLSTGHIIRARWASSSTRDITPTCELWLGIPGTGTLIATLTGATLLDTTEVTDTYTLTGTEADNITDYTDLYLRLVGTGSGGGPGRSLVVEFCELEVPDASGGTTFFQTNTGSMTPAGALEIQVNKSLDGSVTATGSIEKLIQKLLDGSSTLSGDLSTQLVILSDVSGSSTLAGGLSKLIDKKFTGSTAPSGTIQKLIAKQLKASMTPSGGLQKRIEKVLDGSLTPTGTVITAVVILLQLAGQIVMTGALATLFIAGTGAVSKFLGKILKPILRPILKKIMKSHEDE